MQAISQPGDSHRGIPLTQWLDLFMDYALSLARAGRSMEAYEICESARDASVFSRSSEAQFLVHLTWGSKRWPAQSPCSNPRPTYRQLLT